MKKLFISVLLCLSVFFVFGCSNNNVADEAEFEEEIYEEVDDIDDIDLEDEDVVEDDTDIEEEEIEIEEEPEQNK